MNRRLLLVTGLFYCVFGLIVATIQMSAPHTVFAAIAYSEVSLIGYGSLLILAGVLTLAACRWYKHNTLIHMWAAGLRAGSMTTLSLVIALSTFLNPSRGSVLFLSLFMYLSILAYFSTPPPVPSELADELDHARANSPMPRPTPPPE